MYYTIMNDEIIHPTLAFNCNVNIDMFIDIVYPLNAELGQILASYRGSEVDSRIEHGVTREAIWFVILLLIGIVGHSQ